MGNDTTAQTLRILSTLSEEKRLVLALRFGLEDKNTYSYAQIGAAMGLRPNAVRKLETQALRDLRRPSQFKKLHGVFGPPQAIQVVVETVDKLTPELISHLKNHHNDIDKIPPPIFEHLVAEFLAHLQFEDVRLVGRDPKTAADIFAVHRDPLGTKIRLFVETKRTKDKIDIEVFNKVRGAMVDERADIGWHAALIVTTGGFTKSRRYTPLQISLRGVELKDRDDLLRWLDGYKPNKNGLWLPSPKTKVPGSFGD